MRLGNQQVQMPVPPPQTPPEPKEPEPIDQNWIKEGKEFPSDDEEHKKYIGWEQTKSKLVMLGWPIAILLGLFLLAATFGLFGPSADALVWVLFGGWVVAILLVFVFALTAKSTMNHLLVFMYTRMGKAPKIITYLGLDKTKRTYICIPGKKRDLKIRDSSYYLTTKGIIYDQDLNCQGAIAIEGNRQVYDLSDAKPALDENEVNAILMDLDQVAFVEVMKKFEKMIKFTNYQLLGIGICIALIVVVMLNQSALFTFFQTLQSLSATSAANVAAAAQAAASQVVVELPM